MEGRSILEYGAVGDGLFDNSAIFKKALEDGGVIRIPEGVFKTGPIDVKSNTRVVLEKGSVISFIADQDLYEPIYTRWEGVNCYAMHPCILIKDAENVTITGDGIIDGGGEYWWNLAREKRNNQIGPVTEIEKRLASLNPGYENQPGGGGGRPCQFLRPALLQTLNAKNVRLEGFRLQNSPFWTLHPVYTENLVISGVSVVNPYDSPNTDGIDIDSCKNVTIKNCFVHVGDDGIALKSGSGEDGVKTNRATENVYVTASMVLSAHGGIVIGSETAGGIKNVKVEDSAFLGTDRGIRIKTRRGRGGVIENLSFKNLRLVDNLCPVALNMYYRCGCQDDSCFSLDKLALNSTTPVIRNVEIDGISATGSKASNGFIVGLPESPILNLRVKNSNFSLSEHPSAEIDESEMYLGLPEISSRAIRLRNVSATFENVSVTGECDLFFSEEGSEIR